MLFVVKLASGKGNKLQQARFLGLLNNLSTFDLVGPEENVDRESVNPIFAVVHNIITRGIPTLPSEAVEQTFADALRLTKQNEGTSLTFPFCKKEDEGDRIQAIIQALHIIEPRARQREKFLNLTDTDSTFEQSFLLEMIPESKGFSDTAFSAPTSPFIVFPGSERRARRFQFRDSLLPYQSEGQ